MGEVKKWDVALQADQLVGMEDNQSVVTLRQ
jgi:hypothetical protein